MENETILTLKNRNMPLDTASGIRELAFSLG